MVGVDEIPTVQTGSVDLPSEQSTGNGGRHSFSASGDYIDAAVQEQNDVSFDCAMYICMRSDFRAMACASART